MQAVSVSRVCALCTVLFSLAVLPATASATATDEEIDTAVAAAIEYVRDGQMPETGEPGDPESGIVFEKNNRFSSDWIAIALAAAGASSADVYDEVPGPPAKPGPSLQDFLLTEYSGNGGFWAGPPAWLPDTYERPAMVAHAAGLDPARISAEVNLAAQVAGQWNPITGGFGSPSPEAAYNTALGLLALAKTPTPAWALVPATEYLRGIQESDGSWTEALIATADMTATAVAALCEVGVPPYDPTVASGLEYLKGEQVSATGAIEPGNAESAASLVSALSACGIDPQSAEWTTADDKTPVDYLISLQATTGAGAGGFAYEPGEPTNIYSTAYALRAIAGGSFSATPAPREDLSLPSVRTAPTVVAGTPVPHLLAIELAPGNVRMCNVTAPAEAPLTEVLAAGEATSYPAGCISSLALAGGKVSSINGVAPANEDEAWLTRLDRGGIAIAASQPVGFGDTVSLRLGAKPSVPQGAPGGAAASVGPPGPRGRRGKRGHRGRPGRNAHLVCRSHRRKRSGKVKIRCTAKQGQKATLRVQLPMEARLG
jgi:hypothetical protein